MPAFIRRQPAALLIAVALFAPDVTHAEDAKQVFDSLFAAKIKAVGGTADRADDIALAKDMVALAKTSKEQPALLGLLCDAAHDLSVRHADGYATGVEALNLLIDNALEQRPAAREKLAALLSRQAAVGKPDEREAAGETLIDLLMAMGDEKAEQKEYAAAAGDYRRALIVAMRGKSASLDTVKFKLESASARDRAVKQLGRLKEKLQKDGDSATAEEIVKLYLVELDDPAAAVPYLDKAKDGQLKRFVPLATKPLDDIDEANAAALADWYRTMAASTDQAKTIVLARAASYLQRFLDLHRTADLARTQAVALQKDIKATLSAISSAGPNSANGGRFDLLKLVDPSKDSVDGSWQFSGNTLVSPKKLAARLAIPARVSGNYVLTIQFVRQAGDDCLVVSIPIGGAQASVAIDTFANEGCFAGLENINGKRARDNETRLKGQRIYTNQRHTLNVQVAIAGGDATVIATLDKKPILRWTGQQRVLEVNQQASVKDNRVIGLMVWESVYAFESVTIIPKTGGSVTPLR